MNQGMLDMFAAMGFSLTKYFMSGLQGQYWFWLVAAGIGLVFAIGYGATERGGIDLVYKHVGATFLSAFLLFAAWPIDLSQYDYAKPGQLEQMMGQYSGGNAQQGAAPLPTYVTYVIGRTFSIDTRTILSSGVTGAKPDLFGQVQNLTADPRILDDAQLRANYRIWNQVVAPFLLQKDPVLANNLTNSGLMDIFMNPVPNMALYTGSYNAQRSAQVQQYLSQSTASLGDMECTLQSMIDTIASTNKATSWSSSDTTCQSSSINVQFSSNNVGSAGIGGGMSNLYTNLTNILDDKAKQAQNIGNSLAIGMVNDSGISSGVVSVSSLSQLYDEIGRSVLYVAGNKYQTDIAGEILLGSLCDQLSQASCQGAQKGLYIASKGMTADTVKEPEKDFWKGMLDGVGEGISSVFTAVFALIMTILSFLVTKVVPFVIGMATLCCPLVSVIGVYMLLWPMRFGLAIEWMIGPVAWVQTWTMMFFILIQVDTWSSKLINLISSSWSLDDTLMRDVASIVIDIGYLVAPYFAWQIIFGSAAKATHKAGNVAARSIEGGFAAIAMFVKGLDKFQRMYGEPQKTTSGGDIGGDKGEGSTAPPSNSPPPTA